MPLDLRGALRIPELANVEVLRFAVDCLDSLPAQHDVGGCLHQPLAGDDSFAVLKRIDFGPGTVRARKPVPP